MKKISAVILCLVFVLTTGCTRSERFGLQELSRRLENHDERFGFDLAGAYLSDSYYHIPISMRQSEDLLLSCKEDADGRLLQILLTGEANTAPKADFLALANALTAEFFGVSIHKASEYTEQAGMTDETVLFTDHTGHADCGRYEFTFYSTPQSITAMLTYDDSVVAERDTTEN